MIKQKCFVFGLAILLAISLFLMGCTTIPKSTQTTGIAEKGPVKLQLKPWVGEEQTSQMESESKVVMPTGWILKIKIKGEYTSICLGVDNAGVMKIITTTRFSDPEQTMENVPPDQAKFIEEAMKQSKGLYLTKTVSISRMRPDGTVLDNSFSRMLGAVTGTLLSTGQASDLFGFSNLQLSMFPDKPINVGESWTQQTGTNNNINTKSTLLGFDEIQGQKCAKIQIEMLIKIQYGDITSSSTSSLTEYFSTEDGLIVKSVGVNDTIPNQQEQGTTKNSFTTELVKRKKLTPDELKIIQAEADELDIAFGYLQKDNDSANKTLQKFADTHPQSRLKEGVEGIITYMDTMKNMRETTQKQIVESIPTITKVDPAMASASGGEWITITGKGFKDNPAPTVTIGGNPATGVKVLSETNIKAIVPAGIPGPADIVIQNAYAKVKSLPFKGFSYEEQEQKTKETQSK